MISPLRTPIFVFGTLRPGDIGFREAGLDGRVELLGPAHVRGMLYDLGDYPGALLSGNGSIAGELLRPLDDELLSLLDEYEFFDPRDEKESEYLRLRTTTIDGNLSVWIYVYNRCVTDAPVISSGDWRLYRTVSR